MGHKQRERGREKEKRELLIVYTMYFKILFIMICSIFFPFLSPLALSLSLHYDSISTIPFSLFDVDTINDIMSGSLFEFLDAISLSSVVYFTLCELSLILVERTNHWHLYLHTHTHTSDEHNVLKRYLITNEKFIVFIVLDFRFQKAK